MEFSITSDLPKDKLQIKQDDKFYSRILSKESSLANPSFRVYYGVAAGAVPFHWESQPGKPKNYVPAVTLPPLTPPPSYQSNSKNKNFPRKYSLIRTILLPLKLKKYSNNPHSPPQSSLSLSSPSVSSSSSICSSLHRRGRFSSLGSSFSYRDDEEDEYDDGSPISTLCFGGRRLFTGSVCRPVVTMKKALLTVVGHGSRRATTRFVN